jgi:hypothetical protein
VRREKRKWGERRGNTRGGRRYEVGDEGRRNGGLEEKDDYQ